MKNKRRMCFATALTNNHAVNGGWWLFNAPTFHSVTDSVEIASGNDIQAFFV